MNPIMNRNLSLLPQSLADRIVALYSASLLTFVLAGLGSFYYHALNQAIEETQESAALLSEAVTLTITNSAVSGDYDTIRRTLDKLLFRSCFFSGEFIDLDGGVVHVAAAGGDYHWAPGWLHTLALERLSDVKRNISVGGRDYGVLRLELSSGHIAGEIWEITETSLLLAAACLVFGLALIRIPLRRWLRDLDRIHAFDWDSRTEVASPQELLATDSPLEIRRTFDAFRRTAASLLLQRARADVTLGAIADGVITVDKQGNVAYANPVAARLFQCRSGAESLLGSNLKQLLPQEIAATFDDLLRDGEGSRRVEIGTGEGARRIIDCNWTRVGEESGMSTGYVLVCRDVTESQRLDRKLRAELESRRGALASLQNIVADMGEGAHIRFAPGDDLHAVSRFIGELSRDKARVAALLETSMKEMRYQKSVLDAHALVSITDAAGTITYVNDKFAETSGYGADELVGLNHRIVKSGLHSAEFYKDLWDTIRSGMTWHGQFSNRTKSGKIYWVEATIVPWLGEDGLPYQYVSVRTDITAQKDNERALAEARQRERESASSIQRTLLRARQAADEASRAKSAFLANMSHEIRTPLNGIIGTIDLVLDTPLAGEQREYVGLARTSAVSLLEIVNDILDFSKIEAGGLEIARAPFALEQALGDTLKILGQRAREKNLEFRFTDDSALATELIGDAGRLRQVVVNLIGNAIKFTARGMVELRVNATEHAARSVRLRFSVRDSGIGISVSQRERLFQSFAQADASTARLYGGTGLGLAISKGLVEAMQGRIWVESEAGAGSEFIFELPFELPFERGERPAPQAAATAGVAPPQLARSLHVVVVEDNAINRLIVNLLLVKRGHRVTEAGTAAEGLHLIEREQPDLVLMDLQLPGMGGLDALERLRACGGRASRTPVIALTAHALIGDRERCLAAGMNGYVSKPFAAEVLLAEIARVLGDLPAAAKLGETPPQRFARVVEGLEGDVGLFAEIAQVAVSEFGLATQGLDGLAQANDMQGLAAAAHKLKSNWSLYAGEGDEDLPDRLLAAVRERDAPRALALAARLSAALRDAADALRAWRNQYEGAKNA